MHPDLNPWELVVDVPGQTMSLKNEGVVVKQFPVSTSKYGLGFEEGSLKTPLGNFVICEKIGGGAPLGAIFKGRVEIGQIAEPGGDEDLILTRILWLDGIDPENANTKARYVYIHGTNQESLIGQPASHGCIRMRNQEIAELFDLIPVGTPVRIFA